MPNLYKTLVGLLPQSPLLVGEVVLASGDELKIAGPGGAIYSARGAYAVGDTVSFRPGGAVEALADAGLPYVEIQV